MLLVTSPIGQKFCHPKFGTSVHLLGHRSHQYATQAALKNVKRFVKKEGLAGRNKTHIVLRDSTIVGNICIEAYYGAYIPAKFNKRVITSCDVTPESFKGDGSDTVKSFFTTFKQYLLKA